MQREVETGQLASIGLLGLLQHEGDRHVFDRIDAGLSP